MSLFVNQGEKIKDKRLWIRLTKQFSSFGNLSQFDKPTRDQNDLDEAFELLTAKRDFNNWENYLIIANNIIPRGDLKMIERAKQVVPHFPTNSDIKSLFNNIAIGQ